MAKKITKPPFTLPKDFARKLLGIVTKPIDVTLRLNEIAVVCTRYGMVGSLASVGLEVGKRGLQWSGLPSGSSKPMDRVLGKNLARLFIRLGPTFIKLGQVLATRPDISGEAVAEELKILFDRVPPIPYRKIQKLLRQELGAKRLKEAFQSIETKALASASLSQTHRAVLKDGTPVILKVQKPGVGALVRVDISILESMAATVNVAYPKLQLKQIFNDFKEATLREIDYREEAKNIDRFRKNYWSLFNNNDVMFPRYFPELLTERVIALEPMHGSKVSEMKKGTTSAKRAAEKTLAAVLEQIFDHGFFHADPHAGNLFFMEEEGRLGFIDLGMVGQLEPDDKRRFLKVLMDVLNRDREKLAQHLYELGTPSKTTKYAAFEKDVQALLDDVKKSGTKNLKLDVLLNRLMAVARSNGVHIPNRYVLMIRSCLIVEGVARSLDPQISVFQVATPIVAKSLISSYSPMRFIRRLF